MYKMNLKYINQAAPVAIYSATQSNLERVHKALFDAGKVWAIAGIYEMGEDGIPERHIASHNAA